MSDESNSPVQQREELEREKLREEIKQLRAAARTKWITPAAIASLLPLVAGFGLWIAGELKQYNAAYIALAERGKLQAEKDALQAQKDSLNLEVQTLLQLKSYYAAEAERLRQDTERKQATIDQTFLRGVFTRTEAIYSLDHIKGMGPPPDLNEVRKHLGQHSLPDNLSETLNDILQRYEDALMIIEISRSIVSEFDETSTLIPASEWTMELQPMPTGAVIRDRRVMMTNTGKMRRYYDVNEGRFLTDEEVSNSVR